MAITADTLRWYRAERMTDEDDGGGQMSGQEILPGQENQVFDDLSDVDRAAGDVSIRKVYAAVASPDDDKYLDAGALVFRHPADPDVSVLIFSTGDYYDERANMRDLLESSITRGAQYTGWLWGDHIAGQRAVTLWQRESYALPAVGARLEFVAVSGGVEPHFQVLWITRIVSDLVERTDDKGTYRVRMLTLELAEALRANYTGLEPTRNDPTNLATRIYETRYNPEVINLCGIRPLVAPAETGDYTVRIDSLYAPLIPTALAETALADVNPGGDTAALIRAAPGTISFTTTLDAVKPGVSLFIGTPVFPGTLSIGVSGSTITDDGGALLRSGVPIGTIDYGTGICTWTDACPAFGTASKTVTFAPAARPLRVADTAAQAVTVENRGFVWVVTLRPIPQPGSLRVAYRVNDVWYVLTDQGNGTLRGADSSYGSAVLNFGTGTVTLTTGAIPDPGSEILYAWAVPINYTWRGGYPVTAPKVEGQTAHPGVAPGSVTVEWTVGATTYTLADDGAGNLTGTGGSGSITYSTGQWSVTPTPLPPLGTAFEITYDWGDPIEEVFIPSRDGNGDVPITLNALPRAGSVEIEWEMALLDLEDQLALTEEYIPWTKPPTLGGNWYCPIQPLSPKTTARATPSGPASKSPRSTTPASRSCSPSRTRSSPGRCRNTSRSSSAPKTTARAGRTTTTGRS
jgi:hypothetical protein